MSISFNYGGSKKLLIEAIGNATTILASGNLVTVIQSRESNFYNTNRTCDEIAQLITSCNATVTLQEFTKPGQNGWITTAYVLPEDRDVIHYNTEIMSWSAKSQTNTLVHEAIHVIDAFHDQITSFDFTHDGNDPTDPAENVDSAPYWIGNRAEELVDLLDDHVGEEKGFTTLDGIDFAVVRRYLTDQNWAGRRRLICGNH